MFTPEGDKFLSIHDPITTVDQDILERRNIAQVILDRLTMFNPGAVGIYGSWGTGKTSLLYLLKKLNDEHIIKKSDQKDICIDIIDAWKYESSDGLLMPIVARLKKMTGDGDLPEGWHVITRRVLASMTLSVTDVLLKKYAGVDRKEIKEIYEESEKRDKQTDDASLLLEWKNWSDEIENTNLAFKKIVDFVLHKNGYKRIVICIDNLDRCSPENVVRLLESVKNFFSTPNCTWVFAIDSEVVASYIHHKYEGTRIDGNSYLDKIIPEQYHLSLSPAIDGRNIVRLLKYAAGGNVANFDFNEETIPQIPKILVPRRLIKSARKFADFYRMPHADGASPETVFYLTVLYHTWPGFYQRLSSASKDHICGILDNFFPIENESSTADKRAYFNGVILLDGEYAEDRDLSHFLKAAFKGYRDSKNPFVDEIINGIVGLRLTGLP